MAFPLISALSTVVGLVTRKGPNAKANGSGLAGMVLTGVMGPLGTQFQDGLLRGAGTSVEEVGYAVGVTVAGGIAAWIVGWLTPKNAD
jgi:hypothetical protein